MSTFISVDPLADKYPGISPYAYCLNNPVIYVDPTGMENEDFRFIYTDKDGKQQTYYFDDSRDAVAPTEFIQQFQDAYFHDVDNGGGESLKSIAENRFVTVNVKENSLNGEFYSQIYSMQEGDYGDGHNVIKWNPKLGLETNNGYILSPATILEHEADHAWGTIFNKCADQTPGSDSEYETKEERRVIRGSEQKTASANREIPQFAVTRKDHQGLPVVTTSPTSNKVNKKATYDFHESRKFKNENFTIDYRKYRP